MKVVIEEDEDEEDAYDKDEEEMTEKNVRFFACFYKVIRLFPVNLCHVIPVKEGYQIFTNSVCKVKVDVCPLSATTFLLYRSMKKILSSTCVLLGHLYIIDRNLVNLHFS